MRVRCPSPAPPVWRRLASVDRREEAAEADCLRPFPRRQPSRGRRVVGEEDEFGTADEVLGRNVPAELVALAKRAADVANLQLGTAVERIVAVVAHGEILAGRDQE